MIKIINGKRYNTATAIEIGSWSSDYHYNDSRYYSEDLYRTKNGQYFIFSEGGGLNPYDKSLRLISPDEARGWLESKNKIDALEEHFGSSIIDG